MNPFNSAAFNSQTTRKSAPIGPRPVGSLSGVNALNPSLLALQQQALQQQQQQQALQQQSLQQQQSPNIGLFDIDIDISSSSTATSSQLSNPQIHNSNSAVALALLNQSLESPEEDFTSSRSLSTSPYGTSPAGIFANTANPTSIPIQSNMTPQQQFVALQQQAQQAAQQQSVEDQLLLDMSPSLSNAIPINSTMRPTMGGMYSMSMPVSGTARSFTGTPSSFGAYSSNVGGFGSFDVGYLDDNDAQKQLDQLHERRRRRRESHNAVERRRRDNINEKISELASLIPPDPADIGQKPNKGTVLRRSVDYVQHLQSAVSTITERGQRLESALRKLVDKYGLTEVDCGLPEGFFNSRIPDATTVLSSTLNTGSSSTTTSQSTTPHQAATAFHHPTMGHMTNAMGIPTTSMNAMNIVSPRNMDSSPPSNMSNLSNNMTSGTMHNGFGGMMME